MNLLLLWAENIKRTYKVNPYIFAFLYFGGVPFFYYFIYKIIVCLRQKKSQKIIKWSIWIGFIIILPFLYVAIFGRNLPVLFWFVLVVFLFLSFISILRIVNKKTWCPKPEEKF